MGGWVLTAYVVAYGYIIIYTICIISSPYIYGCSRATGAWLGGRVGTISLRLQQDDHGDSSMVYLYLCVCSSVCVFVALSVCL